MANKPSRIIMGIDPGTNRAGYGVISVEGTAIRCIVLGDIELHKYKDPYLKLQRLFTRVCELIDSFEPDEVALESPFFGQNIQSMLKLGRAQGVAMAAALSRNLKVSEYAPRRVKQAVTGQGAASKEQVALVLQKILGIDYDPKRLDATDGLAVALCHYFSCSMLDVDSPKKRELNILSSSSSAVSLSQGKTKNDWNAFIDSNQDRMIKGKKG